MPSTALTETNLPFPLRRGKVRDVYDLGDSLLIIATDRISAYDWDKLFIRFYLGI